jgi:hypothetical protein
MDTAKSIQRFGIPHTKTIISSRNGLLVPSQTKFLNKREVEFELTCSTGAKSPKIALLPLERA